MNRNDPASTMTGNITDIYPLCLGPKWEKTFSSNKYQQKLIKRTYRCDSVKVDNTLLSHQHLPHTNQNRQNMYTKEPLQL